MPKLWNETIEAHRRDVRDAIMDASATLATELGLAAVTMSQIAEQSGIGRATLYKYFSDVEAILVAWHEQRVTDHLVHLERIRDQAEDVAARLEAVLAAYALIAHELEGKAKTRLGNHAPELVSLLHRGEHMGRAQRQ